MNKKKWYEDIEINRLRTKNKKVWSTYKYISDKNQDKEKMLITFTSPKSTPFDKFKHIAEIKKHFSKLLSNLKIDLAKFTVIELGKNLNNPHSHTQLFYNENDYHKIVKAFNKILIRFGLNEKRCIITKTDTTKFKLKYFVYILKEYSKNLTDNKLLELNKARQQLRTNENKNIQIVSHSHGTLSKKVYKQLFYKNNIDYLTADMLYENQFLKIIQNNDNKNYFRIKWSLTPILELLIFMILSTPKTQEIRQKFLCSNKKIIFNKLRISFDIFSQKVGFT